MSRPIAGLLVCGITMLLVVGCSTTRTRSFSVCERSSAAEAESILKADPSLVSARNKDGDTPLHIAALNGNIDVLRVLLKYGANVNAESLRASRVTPLRYAVTFQRMEAAKLLIGAGADVNAADHVNIRPLHEAVWGRKLPMVRLLVESGADVNASYMPDGLATPLWIAEKHRRKEIAAYLRQHGARLNGNVQTRKGS